LSLDGKKDINPVQPAQGDSTAQSSAGADQGQFNYYYLSELLKVRVRFEGESKAFGRLCDIGARKTAMSYPLTACLEVKSRSRGTVFIPWSDVLEFWPYEIVVRKEPGAAPPVDFWLRRDVLDDQVVDLSGAKAIRVNDVHLLHAEGQLIIAHVEVGLLGILRRLGLDKPVSSMLRWLLDYTIKDRFVTWRHVEVISAGGATGEVRISVEPGRLADIHPAELADIMEQLGTKERQTLFNRLPVETAAETLEETDSDIQRALISQERPDKAADVLQEMPAKEAAAILRSLHHSDAQRIIDHMEIEAAEDVKTILVHKEMSAGSVMATFCIEARPDQPAGVILEHVRKIADKVEVFNYIYVLDEERHLLGVSSLRELLHALPDESLESLMTTHVVKVNPETRLKDVAKLFAKYGFRSIPVVDEQDVFMGAVRLISVLAEMSPLFGD
jgi:magnesium transporter